MSRTIIKPLQKLTLSLFKRDQSSNGFTKDKAKLQDPYFVDEYDLTGPGETSAGEDGDDDGMAFLESLLVLGEDDKRTSSQGLTAAGLANILTLFPDICPRYVTTIYQPMLARKPENFEGALIDAILKEASYTTVSDSRQKREDAVKNVPWGREDNLTRNNRYWKCCKALLKLDFPLIPTDYMKEHLKPTSDCLYNAYLRLYEVESAFETSDPKPYTRNTNVKREKLVVSFRKAIAKYPNRDIDLEIKDARAERKRRIVAQTARKQTLEDEKRNLAYYTSIGGIIECHCCFSDTPLNRVVYCAAAEAHPFCWECMKSNAKAQVGMMRHIIHCMDVSGCDAGFSREELIKSVGGSLMNKLHDLQQLEEIQQADLPDLEECPFCEYKAIYPPVEDNCEFRCLKPGCMRISCRRCRGPSHIPITCAESRKEGNKHLRKQVEEAMSNAVIRICPNKKCRTPIIKEDGCNTLQCHKCSTVMCYACKLNISRVKDDHFATRQSCPVEDDPYFQERHERERLAARNEALQSIIKDNPELDEEALGVELIKSRTVRDGVPILYPEGTPNTSEMPRWAFGQRGDCKPQWPGWVTFQPESWPQLRVQLPAANEDTQLPINYEYQLIEKVGVLPELPEGGLERYRDPAPQWVSFYAYAPYPLPPDLPVRRFEREPDFRQNLPWF
ncbi:hypothetical protein TESG_02941 [Trichophyton tonsurans CBS 112818]|uniref:RING-type domain-containing protein n=1 Tax=Trichophyton tonsurans (strain CBS 112818) TaxID=647933 RepID=F2RVW1_TRIT1|nr:hypothetical protein TESG_02941 [Trichophyton tonsurans CBS 112818]